MPFLLVDEEEEQIETPKGRFQLVQEEQIEEPSFAQQAVTEGRNAGIGAAQGGFDLLSLLGLAQQPVDSILNRTLGIQDTQNQAAQQGFNTPGRLNQLQQQSSTLDVLNQGGIPSIADLMALSDDDDLIPYPRSGNAIDVIGNVAQDFPKTGTTQEISRRVARSLPFLLGGPSAFQQALMSEGAGLAAKTGVEALGGSETQGDIADILAGLGTSAGYGLITRAGSASQVPAALANEGGLFAKAEIQAGKRSLERNIQNLEQNLIQDWNQNVSNISQKTFKEFPQFQVQEIAQDLVQGNKNRLLDTVSPTTTNQQAWQGIQQSIEAAFEREAAVYRPLYENVRKGAQSITHTPSSTITAAENGLKRLGQINTQAPGYTAAETTLKTALTDLGKVQGSISYDELGRPLRLRSNNAPPVSDLIELKVRLGDIRNYENLTPTIKDQVLDPVLKALREDIRSGLAKNSKLAQEFNIAETSYANTARRFGKDVISTVRKSENPESLANSFSTGSNVEALKSVLNAQEFAVAERQILERIARQGTEAARQNFEQIERYFSPQAREAGKEAINLGDNLTTVGQRSTLQRRLLENVQESLTNGTRPELLLNTMKTPEGYALAKNAFQNSPKGRELFKTAERQFMADMVDSILDESGKINWKKAANIFRDPQVQKVVSDIGGSSSVEFLERMSKYGYNIGKNFEEFAKTDPGFISSLVGNLSSPTKALLTGLLGTMFGLPQAIALRAGYEVSKEVLLKTLSNRNIQNILRNLAEPKNYNRKDLVSSISRLNNYLNEDSEDGIPTE